MAITLQPEIESMVQDRIASGRYPSEQEVLREALKLLETRESLLAAIEVGDRQYAEGNFREFSLEGLQSYRTELLARIANGESGEKSSQ